jgi:hypothetical protein
MIWYLSCAEGWGFTSSPYFLVVASSSGKALDALRRNVEVARES